MIGWLVFACIFMLTLLIRMTFMKGRLTQQLELIREEDSSERHIVHLVEHSKDVVYYFQIEPEYKFVYLSKALDTFLGEGTRSKGLKNPFIPFNLVHPNDRELLFRKVSGEVDYNEVLIQRWIDQSGRYRWFEEHACPIYEDGKFIAVQGIMRNIDEKIRLQQDLEYRVSHDALTGIYNRAYFDERFAELNDDSDMPAGIIVGDLDNLKQVNDQEGHKAGDALLIDTANLLRKFSSDSVTVSRNGGDEFVLLVIGEESQSLQTLVTSINEEIENHNLLRLSTGIHISFGYAASSHSWGMMKQLFMQADENMYKNKEVRKEGLGHLAPTYLGTWTTHNSYLDHTQFK